MMVLNTTGLGAGRFRSRSGPERAVGKPSFAPGIEHGETRMSPPRPSRTNGSVHGLDQVCVRARRGVLSTPAAPERDQEETWSRPSPLQDLDPTSAAPEPAVHRTDSSPCRDQQETRSARGLLRVSSRSRQGLRLTEHGLARARVGTSKGPRGSGCGPPRLAHGDSGLANRSIRGAPPVPHTGRLPAQRPRTIHERSE
jgi:hypothetical protein